MLPAATPRVAGNRSTRRRGSVCSAFVMLKVCQWPTSHDYRRRSRSAPDTSLPRITGSLKRLKRWRLAMSFACINLGMSPDEALAAVTINAARALLLDDEIGSLEPGKVADVVVWRVPTSTQIPYWPGADLVRTVVKRGRVVHERGDR